MTTPAAPDAPGQTNAPLYPFQGQPQPHTPQPGGGVPGIGGVFLWSIFTTWGGLFAAGRAARKARALGYSKTGKYWATAIVTPFATVLAGVLLWVAFVGTATHSVAGGQPATGNVHPSNNPATLPQNQENLINLPVAGPNDPVDESPCPVQLPSFVTAPTLTAPQATQLITALLQANHYGLDHRNRDCLALTGETGMLRYKALGSTPMQLAVTNVSLNNGGIAPVWTGDVTATMGKPQPLTDEQHLDQSMPVSIAAGLDPKLPTNWQLA